MEGQETYLIVALGAVLAVAAVAAIVMYGKLRRRRYLLRRIRRGYGKIPEQEYEPGDFGRISHFYRKTKGEAFCIDDITWNDLDMDSIFMLLNQTVSSPGEDVLYAMLRKPLFTREEVEERAALIQFFETEKEKREKMQILLGEVGKPWHQSLADSVFSIEDAPKASLGIHVLMLGALLVSLAVMPFYVAEGIAGFVLLSIINMFVYLGDRDHKIIAAYMDSFGCLLHMLKAGQKLEKVSWKETEKQVAAVKEAGSRLSGLRRKASFLAGKNSGTGDALQGLMTYVYTMLHIDVFVYNSVLKEVRQKADWIIQMAAAMGELDACIAVSSFRKLLPFYCEPRFRDWNGGQAELQVENLYHPMIPNPVANSIHAVGGTLVTGSNASGKSTFLKNVAIGGILAQTVCTCTSTSWQSPFLKVMTSMALRDDLAGGESYFIVEIRSLKRILDESEKPEPLLCIIDEVLRGTNTVERIAASSRILASLAKNNTLPFAATHDIELSYMLEGIYQNYHFEEEIRDNQIVFNYLLQNGRAVTRNAIRLLSIMGYDKEIVEDAQKAAEEFENTGVWGAVPTGKYPSSSPR